MNFEISRDEMEALVIELQHHFVQPDRQRLVYNVVHRMEKELEKNKGEKSGQ